ncbi:MAG TPA: hypothetical protein DIC52_18205 [Candidatus Latescibacteria bacterium]|jgi:hypothetical protein|nr:hypothetical protein [Candidatus Latescibacterota bacterium]
MRRPFLTALGAFLLISGCDLSNSVAQRPHGPSRVLMGPIVTSAWLPAGIDEFRFSAADQRTLAEFGLTHIQWLQRAEQDGRSAEALAMAFASQQGMGLPVYYEAPGYSPYDKLRNWATKSSLTDSFDVAVRARATALTARWGMESGFAGYLIGHEDYRANTYEALGRTVTALRAADPTRPAFSVGAIGSYPKTSRFLDAFFAEGGEPNVFQHEHYVFEADVEAGSSQALRRLDHLVAGYDRVARHLRDRHGRWHAIVQAHAESRDNEPFYRQPIPAELSVQVGLALSRGAAGVVYFLYSSGTEQVLDGNGEIVQIRQYMGLVDNAGQPTNAWSASREINARLASLSRFLEDRAFLGGYEARRAPADEPLASHEEDLDLAFFGDASGTSHVLVVNRRTDAARTVVLEAVAGSGLTNVESGQVLESEGTAVTLPMKAGDFQLLAVR